MNLSWRSTVLRVAVALALLLAIAAAAFCASAALWEQFRQLDPNVTAAIIAALAATAGGFYSLRQTGLREIHEAHREQKVQLYEKYMDIIDLVMNRSRENRLDEIAEDSIPQELEELFQALRRGLLVWASPGVIQAYERFRIRAEQGGLEALRGADAVFRAIRKDLGNSNWGLSQGALIKLFLKDPTEYDRMPQ